MTLFGYERKINFVIQKLEEYTLLTFCRSKKEVHFETIVSAIDFVISA